MITKAYILIETRVGRSKEVAEKLQSIPGVEEVDAVTGPYDIIAVTNSPDLNAAGDLVTTQIHGIEGIVRTVSCLSVNGVGRHK